MSVIHSAKNLENAREKREAAEQALNAALKEKRDAQKEHDQAKVDLMDAERCYESSKKEAKGHDVPPTQIIAVEECAMSSLSKTSSQKMWEAAEEMLKLARSGGKDAETTEPKKRRGLRSQTVDTYRKRAEAGTTILPSEIVVEGCKCIYVQKELQGAGKHVIYRKNYLVPSEEYDKWSFGLQIQSRYTKELGRFPIELDSSQFQLEDGNVWRLDMQDKMPWSIVIDISSVNPD
ncbi:hypothetical protein ACHAXN_006126 [Cyclotella atomus]